MHTCTHTQMFNSNKTVSTHIIYQPTQSTPTINSLSSHNSISCRQHLVNKFKETRLQREVIVNEVHEGVVVDDVFNNAT